MGFDLRVLSAVRFEDELWLGFLDVTDLAHGEPYRVVRVGRNCRYETLFGETYGR